ncbi:MAG: glycine cleavage system aminomethyltransferase GcvT [Dermabacter sp.]|nr:glycine cleavage system aminomethyltransferase GcvT [Dermabacter sp.]
MSDLLTSPLEGVHERLGASFTDFAGWNMPVRYTSDLAEHAAVRERAGQFDLSHMGEVFFTGPGAGEALDYALAGKISTIEVGRAKYTLLLNADGGIIDDLIVYRLGDERFLVVPNAGNRLVDAAALKDRAAGFDVVVEDRSEEIALIAVQGPASARLVRAFAESADVELDLDELDALKYYRIAQGTYRGEELLVARTGYTGEDGFELYVPAALATAAWEAVETLGGDDISPCGLACRDTLRLEAGMPLYGNELTTEIVPAQAGLGRVVAYKTKGDFVGRSALEGVDFSDRRILVGLVAEGRRAGRAGYPLVDADGAEIGVLTSGALAPTLGHPIAMAYVDRAFAEPGTALAIDVRGKRLEATVVPLPFYKRGA